MVPIEKKLKFLSSLRIYIRVGCVHLVPQVLGIGVCRRHLWCQEKVLLLHLVVQILHCRRAHGRGREEGWNTAYFFFSHALWTLSTQMKKSLFLCGSNVRDYGPIAGPMFSAVISLLPCLGESQCPSLLSVLSKELPQFSSASKHLLRGFIQAF